MGRIIRKILASPYRWLLAAWWRVMPRTTSESAGRRVLVCAHNELLASYLLPICDELRRDKRLSLYFTGPPYHPHRDRTTHQLADILGLPVASYFRARASWWDLILFADNASAAAFYPEIKKGQLYHSLGSGKIIGGGNYRYGQRALLQDGQPCFTRMFEASETVRENAIASQPALADVIVTVGDLKADAMLALQDQREDIRRSMGFSQQDKVVLIQSTWGEASLMESMGAEIIAEAQKLMDRGEYRFILSTHPNHWTGAHAEDHPWGKVLEAKSKEGFLVIRLGEDFDRHHIAADIAVTDHTGISLNFALLHKPTVFIPIPEGTVMPESWEARLKALSPILADPFELGQVLQDALDHYPLEELRGLSLKINSCPGEAARNIRDEIYRVLKLSQTVATI